MLQRELPRYFTAQSFDMTQAEIYTVAQRQLLATMITTTIFDN
jgi:hypothetical protein